MPKYKSPFHRTRVQAEHAEFLEGGQYKAGPSIIIHEGNAWCPGASANTS